MPTDSKYVRLAYSLLASDWTEHSLARACRRMASESGVGWRKGARVVAQSAIAQFPRAPKDRAREFAAFLKSTIEGVSPRIVLPSRSFRMATSSGDMLHNRWGVPVLNNVDELATFVGVSLVDLQWFADTRTYQVRERKEQLHHYSCTWLKKRNGGFRLIEEPKPRLKAIQRMLLHRIIEQIPPHPAAHGFVPHHSVHTAAQPHVRQQVVIRVDLAEFFPTVTAARIYAIFRSCGYPEAVATILCALTTTVTPVHVRNPHRNSLEHPDHLTMTRLRHRHLP
jgi:RNA-directed DNA polymerase